jgi:hypothetical protein
MGALALAAVLATHRSADAWCNSKFSIGLNWSCQSGNNNLLWGFYRNGQIPEDYGHGYGGPGPGPYGPPVQPFPYFGNNGQQSNMPQANMAMPPMPNTPQPGVAQAPQAPTGGYGYNDNFYQASYQAGYAPNYGAYGMAAYPQGYYYAPYYYAPSYGSDPFTWYGQR